MCRHMVGSHSNWKGSVTTNIYKAEDTHLILPEHVVHEDVDQGEGNGCHKINVYS